MSKKERKREMRRAKRLLDAESIDFHLMFDEYERLWAYITPHDSTTPLPSGDLGIKGLQDKMTLQCLETELAGWTSKMVVKANVFLFFAKAFGLEMGVMFVAEEVHLVLEMGGEDDTAITQLRRHLLNREQHRWAPHAMERRTGQIGLVKPEISELEFVVAIREVVREMILQCTVTQEGQAEGEDGDDDDDVGSRPEGEDWDMQEPDPVEAEQLDAESVEDEPVEAGIDDAEDMKIDTRTCAKSGPDPSEEEPTPGSLAPQPISTEDRHISPATTACDGSDPDTRTSVGPLRLATEAAAGTKSHPLLERLAHRHSHSLSALDRHTFTMDEEEQYTELPAIILIQRIVRRMLVRHELRKP
ncbi:hypothetical protein LTR53_000647 [Teratosphaeriaceae sp. CCFEE 6253]|nr:hypothetical protein LTR53_000647 [Teratosphaeriaceae sp. CCFEE 6253]